MKKMVFLSAAAWMLLIAHMSAAARESVSVFVASDRHAHYETVQSDAPDAGKSEEGPADSEKTEGGTVDAGKPEDGSADSGKPENGSDNRKKSFRNSSPVYDRDGNLIWHNNLTVILELVAQDPDAVQPQTLLLCGDNVGTGADRMMDSVGYPMGAPYYSTSGIKSQINGVMGDDIQTLFTYGSHDRNETEDYEDIFYSGPEAQDGFYIYGISFAQMIYDSPDQIPEGDFSYTGKDLDDPFGMCAQTASHHFLMWVKGLEDHLPIIVVSHVPLHASRGDNTGAWTWTRALNEAAQDHEILFLWGHNHTLERREQLREKEQALYLCEPGDVLITQSWDPEMESDTAVVPEQISFIYINAGYIINGVGTLLTFSDEDQSGQWDTLTAKRYALDEEGTLFGNTGYTSPWVYSLRQWDE